MPTVVAKSLARPLALLGVFSAVAIMTLSLTSMLPAWECFATRTITYRDFFITWECQCLKKHKYVTIYFKNTALVPCVHQRTLSLLKQCTVDKSLPCDMYGSLRKALSIIAVPDIICLKLPL